MKNETISIPNEEPKMTFEQCLKYAQDSEALENFDDSKEVQQQVLKICRESQLINNLEKHEQKYQWVCMIIDRNIKVLNLLQNISNLKYDSMSLDERKDNVTKKVHFIIKDIMKLISSGSSPF